MNDLNKDVPKELKDKINTILKEYSNYVYDLDKVYYAVLYKLHTKTKKMMFKIRPFCKPVHDWSGHEFTVYLRELDGNFVCTPIEFVININTEEVFESKKVKAKIFTNYLEALNSKKKGVNRLLRQERNDLYEHWLNSYKKFIYIHIDFRDGTEISYEEGKKSKESFSTNCLEFFNFDLLDNGVQDVYVLSKHGRISLRDLLYNKGKGYCEKEIRLSHNVYKMLVAGSFEFKPYKESN